MEDAEKWTTSANTAIKIRLINPSNSSDSKIDPKFSISPAFTYPIFGEEETIFGWSGLRVTLDLKHDTLQPSLKVEYKDKVEEVGDVAADEPEEILSEFLPSLGDDEDVTDSKEYFEPPGERIYDFTIQDKSEGTEYTRTFGVWAANLADPKTKRIIRNGQILMLFFIEGASMIELDDPDWTIARWTVFFLYEDADEGDWTSYQLVGYSTSYRLFFVDPPATAPTPSTALQELPQPQMDLMTTIPCRERISQFLILPPHQGANFGSQLYTAMIMHFLHIPHIRTITVEDPNEKFDDMRDFNDMIRLRKTSVEFRNLKLNTSTTIKSKSDPLPVASLIPTELYELMFTTSRIAPRQFARLVEMQLLSSIPERHRSTSRITRKDKATDTNDRAYYFWRLIVKQRLYHHNLDQLSQLEVDERVEKLEETVGSVEADYVRLLAEVEKREKRLSADYLRLITDSRSNGTKHGAESDLPTRKKRRILDDDDEDDDDGDVVMESIERPATQKASTNGKRQKVEVIDLD